MQYGLVLFVKTVLSCGLIKDVGCSSQVQMVLKCFGPMIILWALDLMRINVFQVIPCLGALGFVWLVFGVIKYWMFFWEWAVLEILGYCFPVFSGACVIWSVGFAPGGICDRSLVGCSHGIQKCKLVQKCFY